MRNPIGKDFPANRLFLLVLSIVLVVATSCKTSRPPASYYKVFGLTQGTDYMITYRHTDSTSIKPEIDSLLRQFDLSLSTYIPNSIISRINRNEAGVKADELFMQVWEEALRVHELTGGAFDMTVGPLVDAWGFGPGRKLEMDERVIDSLMQFVGMEKVQVKDGRVIKEHPEIQFDVNAIAQGFAVEVVSDYLESLDISDYMVNIGGEIKCRGVNPKGIAWRIGVDKPEYGNLMPGQQLQVVIQLEDKSLASSGNYRKYYELDGKKIVHTIDPATGYTRPSHLLSATIITDDCMTADALATSCMVMGLDRARELVSGLENVEAYLVFTDEDGLFFDWNTPGMEGMIIR